MEQINDINVDFTNATIQEKILLMMNERVGQMENEMHKINTMLTNLHYFISSSIVSSFMTLPSAMEIDETFLDKVIDAVQNIPCVLVDTAWAVVLNNAFYGDNHHIRIFLKLEKPVLLKEVASEMTARIVQKTASNNVHEWSNSSNQEILNDMSKANMKKMFCKKNLQKI